MRDIPTLIQTHAIAAGYLFAYGDLEYQNYESHIADLTDGDYIFMLLPVISRAAEIANGATIDKWDVDIKIYFGRKFDDSAEAGTYSSIDETFLQKHTRRLQACREALVTFIESLTCSTDLELINLSINDAVNIFSISMDAVIATIVLRHDHDIYPDIVVPTLDSAEIGDEANNIIVLDYGELLDTDSVPLVGDFELSGATPTIISVAIILTKVKLTLSGGGNYNETILLNYTVGTNPIRDRAENEAVSLSDESVTNNISYDDWFLPSKDELNKMYDNLHVEGVGGFDDVNYHSSSEADTSSCFRQQFSTGKQDDFFKSSINAVRACRTFTSTVSAYSLRDTGEAGGLIFYIDGTTFYEAAPSDQSSGKVWSNIEHVEIGGMAQGTAIGTGQANTTAIIAQEGHTDSAAKLCDDLII